MLSDMPVLVELARQLVAEGRFARFGFMPEKVERYFTAMLDSDKTAIFVYEQDGEVIGGVGCASTEDWFSPIPSTYEMGVMVFPEKRGGMAGPRLMQAYSEWAEQFKGTDVDGNTITNKNAGVTSGIGDTNRTAAIWRRLGFGDIGVLLSNFQG